MEISQETGMVTRERRAELRRLHEAATPGDWKLFDRTAYLQRAKHLIVDSHNALPALLDTIDALEAENARLEAESDYWRERCELSEQSKQRDVMAALKIDPPRDAPTEQPVCITEEL